MAMDVKLDTQIFFLIHMILIISFTTLPQTRSHSMEDGSCSLCNLTYNCGTIRNISYPFWGQGRPSYCGSGNLFKLECHDNQTTSIQIGQQNFNVVSIEPIFYSMKMVGTDLSVAGPWNFTNTSLDPTLFRHDNYTFHNLTIFYDCPTQVSSTNNITCKADQRDKVAFHANEAELQKWPHLLKCGVQIQMRVQRGITEDEMKQLNRVLRNGFVVHYTGLDDASGRDGIHDSQRPKKSPWNWKRKLIVGGAASSFSVIVMSIAFYLYLRRNKNRYAKSSIQSQLQTMSSDSSLKDLERGSKYFGVHLFTYSELEEATNYFDSTRELGDGGFGTVYCGKLRDGRTVAVKRLYENNCRRMEQFMNEVEILTRLHHQNLVSLYGRTSRHSRELLLVYEYIPNGTVADHLHGERAKPGSLPWHVRINIAIETASALAYLHASDIIHRDVKTTNILLDNHFCVKVADFGLSRLFPNDVTHISTAPQGTPGYVDPEYHQCYQLTDKSDVYSFGVVLIELISSMPAVDITRHRHEINLSNMAINKIQNGALPELVDPILGFEADCKVRKMINGVAELAFQCLQSVKDMRPSMEHVLQRLMDIQNDGKDKTKAEEMDISADDVVLLKNEPPPPSPDSNLRSTSTTPNASG